MQKDDRQTRRTRRALAAALMELAATCPYESITIRSITDLADVGYATFFRHYDSKDDLMLDIFQNVAHDLESMAGEHGSDFHEKEGLLIFTHVQKNERLYRSILESRTFTRKLQKLFSEHIERRIELHAVVSGKRTVPVPIAINHMAAALVSLIEWWLENGMQPPIKQMGQIYDRLIIQATWYAVRED